MPHRLARRERARVQRRKTKEQARKLATSVASLRRLVHTLALEAQTLRGLVQCRVQPCARQRILTHLSTFANDPRIIVPGFCIERFDLLRATGSGSENAPVVEIKGRVSGRYSRLSLEVLYCFIPGHTALLDRLLHAPVQYPCVLRFFFTRDGICEADQVELNWFYGMIECVGQLDDVSRVISPLRGLGPPVVDRMHSPTLGL